MTCRCAAYTTVIAADAPVALITCDSAVPTGTTLQPAAFSYTAAYTVTVGPTAPSGNGSVQTGPSVGASFTGYGDHLEMTGVTLPASDGPWTLEAWMHMDGVNPHYTLSPNAGALLSLFSTILGHEMASLVLNQVPGGVAVVGTGGQLDLEAGLPSALVWHHVAVSAQGAGGTSTCYVDCRPVATAAGGGIMSGGYTSDKIVVGARNVDGAFPFSGALADLAVYDYALSPCQVMCHYEAATGLRCCGRPARAQVQIIG